MCHKKILITDPMIADSNIQVDRIYSCAVYILKTSLSKEQQKSSKDNYVSCVESDQLLANVIHGY